MTRHSADRLREILLAAEVTVAVAESLTAGHLQSLISSASGSSATFEGGITAYNLDQKVRLLGVDRAVAEPVDCVSEEVAVQMAAGVRALFGCQVGVATTGYAEPLVTPPGNTTPFAFYAIDIAGRISVGRVDVPGRSRTDVQKSVAEAVLERLIETLEGVGDLFLGG